MAFNKGILMLAIIASIAIFEVMCLPPNIKKNILKSSFINKCGRTKDEIEFDRLLTHSDSSIAKSELMSYLQRFNSSIDTSVKNFDQLLNDSLTNFEECETKAIFSQLSQRGKNAKAPMFSVPSDFPLACDASSHYITCAENFLDSVHFCESQPSRDRRNLITGAIRSYVGYLCSENAKRLIAFAEKEDCIKKSFDNDKCFDEMFSRPKNVLAMDFLNKTFVPKVENCLLNIFDPCPSTDPLFSPSVTVKKFITSFKDLARSIVNLSVSTDTYDEFLDPGFYVFAF